MTFYDTDLNDDILDALDDMRFNTCTPIQEQCIPAVIEGRDVLGIAQTGTGKTAAYLLPILSMLADGNFPDDTVNCLIMAPTRELVQQIDQAFQGFSYYLPKVTSLAVYGGNDGMRYDQEVKGLKMGSDIIIATPGRLLSHMRMDNVDFSKVSFFVLDEADRMLDMGFIDDIETIAKCLPQTHQTLMFSATMPKDIEQLASQLLKNPVRIKIAASKPAEKIKQQVIICYEPQKLKIIERMFKDNMLKRVLLFAGKKTKVKEINRALRKMRINSGAMHSDLSQQERNDIMYRFKSGQTDVLVATDILARGIDIDDISMVINYDVPRDAEDYVHRVGRTARAQKEGAALTLVSQQDFTYLGRIEKMLGKATDKVPLPKDLGEAPEISAAERQKRQKRRYGRNDAAPKKRQEEKAGSKKKNKRGKRVEQSGKKNHGNDKH